MTDTSGDKQSIFPEIVAQRSTGKNNMPIMEISPEKVEVAKLLDHEPSNR